MSLNRVVAAFLMAAALLSAGADWRQFRGNDGSSVAASSRLPVTLDDGTNLAWRRDLPGKGVSGAIVVGDRVFVTASSGVGEDRLHVLAFSVASGEPLWERQFWATGRTICHPTSAVAAPTPSSDGQRIYAFYSSNDLVCLDLDGNLQWLRGFTYDSPTAANDTGMASSPLVVDGTVVVQIESQGDSFCAGIDVLTGATLWRVERGQAANWASPVSLSRSGEKELVLLQSGGELSAHDPRSGEQRFLVDGEYDVIASTVTSERLMIVPSEGLTALRAEPGSEYELLWQENQLRPSNASPVVHEGRVYVVNGAGVLVCGDTATGDVLWRVRLKGPFWATPVVAGGHIYCVNQDGVVHVVRLGEEGELVSRFELEESVLATPAVADDAIFLRSNAHLWKFASQ